MADQLLMLSGNDFISPVGEVSVAEWASCRDAGRWSVGDPRGRSDRSESVPK
jgi:hypothetical protein